MGTAGRGGWSEVAGRSDRHCVGRGSSNHGPSDRGCSGYGYSSHGPRDRGCGGHGCNEPGRYYTGRSDLCCSDSSSSGYRDNEHGADPMDTRTNTQGSEQRSGTNAQALEEWPGADVQGLGRQLGADVQGLGRQLGADAQGLEQQPGGSGRGAGRGPEPRPKAVLLLPHASFSQIIAPEVDRSLREVAEVIDLGGKADLDALSDGQQRLQQALLQADAVFTSWGSPYLSKELLEQAVRLRFIGHCAGSIRPYVDPFALEHGITVINAARVMGRGVAEMTLLFALAALRSLVPYQLQNKPQHRWAADQPMAGLFEQTVGLVGLGQVGRQVLQLLRPFHCHVLVYDPYLPDETARTLGVEKAALNEVFARSRIISLHAAVTPETTGMIGAKQFAQVQDGAIFINTARGRLVDYEALVEAARRGRFTICLDVTDPHEPLPGDSPLWDLPNVLITPHIAGPTPDRRVDMGQDVIGRWLRFLRGEQIEGVITLAQYRTMA